MKGEESHLLPHLNSPRSREEESYPRHIFSLHEDVPVAYHSIEIHETGMHHPLILYDKISNIEKVLISLESRDVDREFHEKEEVILYLRIESEDIIERVIFLYHRFCMEVDNMLKCLFFFYIGAHHLDQCRDLPDLLEEESYQWFLDLSYIPTERHIETQIDEDESEDESDKYIHSILLSTIEEILYFSRIFLKNSTLSVL